MVEKCMVCNGTVRSTAPLEHAKCIACNGTGNVKTITCPICNGSGSKLPSRIVNTRRLPCCICDNKGYKKYNF